MRAAAYIAGLLGLALLTLLVVHADVPAILDTWKLGGAPLLWLGAWLIVSFTLALKMFRWR